MSVSDAVQVGQAEASEAKAAKRAKAVTSADVIIALARRYAAPAWAFFEQVAPGTGWKATGWADAMALSIWPSRGLDLYGFEVKVSRADWLRELKNPQKADAFVSRCHRWWIVAPPGCVQTGELPPNWGLIEYRSGKLFDVVQAAKIEPLALEWSFLAAMLRRVAEANVPKSTIEDRVAEAVEQARKNDSAAQKYELEKHAALRKAVDLFEATSGVRITGWSGRNVGQAVRLLQDLDVGRRIKRQRDSVKVLLEQLEAAVAAMPNAAADVEELG